MSERDSMHDEPSTQRKRIAVACGRCRKRKIRCTGDNGTGQPCLNCKNAGFEPCQFLRVASQETTFAYNVDMSRHYQARGSSMVPPGPSSSSSMTSYVDALSMLGSEAPSYRNGSAYAYNGRSVYPVSGIPSGYAEDGIDYSTYQQQQQAHQQQTPPTQQTPTQQSQQQPQPQTPQQQQQPQSYQTVPETSYMMSYRVAPSTAPPAKASSNSALYVESEPSYSYASGSSAASLVHRPVSSTTDSSSYSFQGGFSNSFASGDRVLPTPTPRPLSTTGQHPYRAESISSGYSKTSHYENSPMPTSYPSTSLSSHTSRQNDVYTTSAPSQSEASLPTNDEPLRATAPELTYKYQDTTGHYRSTYNDNLRYSGSAHSYLPPTHGHATSYMVGGDVSAAPMEPERKPDIHSMRS
ncbi:hypothetical protein PT974_05524 [Cladobotryum mycophilum]|uniref:Zn(2)-C6 fungal-type domain-containing protein n=1 Tax=Cladobotryum mycophilum TaxID=491253 RepID=A0ABR0SIY5_9HYPO